MKIPKYGLTQQEHAALVAATGRPATHEASQRSMPTQGKDGDLSLFELRRTLGLNGTQPPDDDDGL